MSDRATLRLSADVLRNYMEDILSAAGCPPSTASTCARIFLEADLRGVGLQGLDHMHTMITSIQRGYIDPKAEPVVTEAGPGFAKVDGMKAPGQLAALLAVEVAISGLQTAATYSVAIANSSDVFMLGYYVEQIARRGMIGMLFTGAPPQVHPPGGIEAVLGTNPLAISVPTDDDDPILIDMSTSALSGSKIRQASYFGERVPGAGVDQAGVPTDDPNKIRAGGAIATAAGAKGFALSLAVALLSGPLVGADTGRALRGWSTGAKEGLGKRGHFMLAINPGMFTEPQVFRRAASAYLKEIRTSRKSSSMTPIRIPGDRVFQTRARSLKEGVLLYEAVWDRAATIARDLKVTVPAVQ